MSIYEKIFIGILVFLISFITISVVKSQELVIHPSVECLAKNIYFEARNQNEKGQIAVGLVTLNRAKDNRFPDNVCDVVYQAVFRGDLPMRHRCQFSWYCDGKPDVIRNTEAYQKIIDLLPKVYYYSLFNDITNGSTHYHAKYVSPKWRKEKIEVASIGDHIFYRWDRQ